MDNKNSEHIAKTRTVGVAKRGAGNKEYTTLKDIAFLIKPLVPLLTKFLSYTEKLVSKSGSLKYE